MSGRDRLAATFVLVVLALACVGFMTALPAGTLWAISKLTENATTHFVASLIAIPALMALAAPALFSLNRLYLRISGVAAAVAEDEDELGWRRRVSGPLEPMLLASFVIALAALLIWIFVFADSPPIGIP